MLEFIYFSLLFRHVFRNISSAWRTDPTCTLETQRYAALWMCSSEDRTHGKRVHLYLLLSQLASNISSFAVCNDFLLITTHSHTCRCLHLSTLSVKGRMDTHIGNVNICAVWVQFMIQLSWMTFDLQGCRRPWPQMEVRMTRVCGGWREDPGSSLWYHKIPESYCRSV